VAALRLAFERPDMVKAVVADSCVAVWRPGDVHRLLEGRGRLSLGQMAFWQKAHGNDWQAVVDADTEMISAFLETGIDFYEGRLGEIRCRVLLTDSLADEMLPRVEEQVREMARQIRNCRMYLAKEGRHPLMWSGAEGFRREADAFLGEIE
jgi:pimeloyl-ACP methyl ester carboxylesterase